MKYILNTDKGRAFIRDLRIAVKGAGFGGVKLRGRNACRTQFAMEPGFRVRAYSRDLPLKYASHYYFELPTMGHSIFNGLRALYEQHGEKVIIEGPIGKKIKA